MTMKFSVWVGAVPRVGPVKGRGCVSHVDLYTAGDTFMDIQWTTIRRMISIVSLWTANRTPYSGEHRTRLTK